MSDITYHAVVVIPTYNERDNILKLIPEVLVQETSNEGVRLSVLIVDDNSPDGTATAVRRTFSSDSRVRVLSGDKNGYGDACRRGFLYALNDMEADFILQMDADFSHDPREIPFLIHRLLVDSDVVIGSRYILGGSIPQEWPFMRRLNSKLGNAVARYIAGMRRVQDCTGGFRAIRSEVVKRIQLDELGVKGYAFQISLLHAVLRMGVRVREIPIHFRDRTDGISKLRFQDRIEFILHAVRLRLDSLKTILLLASALAMTAAFFVWLDHIYAFSLDYYGFIVASLILISIALSIQSAFTIIWMLYAWENPSDVALNKSPDHYTKPRHGFTALLPARQEEAVIADTIHAIDRIDYPDSLKELIVICKSDDYGTIQVARNTIRSLGKDSVKLITFDDGPVNKPHALNIGMQHASKDTIVVFDAEDEPHTDIYRIVNTIMMRDKADVVQSGVQLMNFMSHWFSPLNVLEYYFWFKSALHFFSRVGLVPLGGNTVFLKKKWLERVQGWDEECLTEDADIGIRLSLAGASMRVVYDEKHCTREETPDNTESFMRQRSRWNQGFLQVFFKGYWSQFPTTGQKLLALYILLWPQVQTWIFLYLPISFLLLLSLKVPVWITIITMLPLYLLIIQFITYMIGLYHFTRDYKFRFPLSAPFLLVLSYLPFQFILGYSAMRAMYRFLIRDNGWDKTAHANAHRHLATETVDARYL